MKTLPLRPFKNKNAAMSLVELLLVIAIIGILTTVVLTYLNGDQKEVMDRVRDRRNAQEIASIIMGAEAAGAPVIAANDMEGTIENLMQGREGTQGTFKNRVFRLSRLSPVEVQGAMRFLEWHQGLPAYVGSHP